MRIRKSKSRAVVLVRFRVSIRMLIGLIACCGVGLWASRGLWDPVLIAVSELHDPIPSKRVDAVQKLSRIGGGRYETVIPPLTRLRLVRTQSPKSAWPRWEL